MQKRGMMTKKGDTDVAPLMTLILIIMLGAALLAGIYFIARKFGA